MSAPTVAVTCTAFDQGGQPVAGARFRARLDQTEIYNGFIVQEVVDGLADANGVCVLQLWPNALGVAGSMYLVQAWNPDSGKKFLEATVSVPDSACNLHEILTQAPYPAIDAAQQALIAAQAALAPVTAQAGIATTQAGQAAGSAVDALASQLAAAASQATALDAATAAGLSRDTAQTQAGQATSQASSAGLSASAASTSAGAAQTSATAAGNSAASAAGSADSADSRASAAAGSADAANASASDFKLTDAEPVDFPAAAPEVPPSPAGPPEATPEVSFVRQARRREFWKSPLVRALLGLMCLLLLAALALQWVVRKKDILTAQQPQLAPLLQALCRPLGCQIRPLRRIESLVIDSSNFSKTSPGSYHLTFVFKNTGAVALEIPALEVTLTDSRDQVLVRRVVMPAQFGATAVTLGAYSELAGAVSLKVSSEDAQGGGLPAQAGPLPVAGYRILAFYP
jgi:hypothetical protein